MTLVDTGPLVALCDPRDRLHSAALADLPHMARGGLRTCDAVLTEAVFHLPGVMQRRRLSLVLDQLDIDLVPTHDGPFVSDAFGWLSKYGAHQPDWADACLAVLAGRNARWRVWTYDREFRTIWRKPDGRPIPLAVKA